MIDKVHNDDLLEIVYQVLESKISDKEGQLLNKLTFEEKKELYKAYYESLDNSKLVDLDQIKKDHAKWQEK